MSDDQDQHYLIQAIELAKKSVDLGGGPFGAVIIKDDKIIGQGHNQVTLHNDPTAHAEVTAIRNVCASTELSIRASISRNPVSPRRSCFCRRTAAPA